MWSTAIGIALTVVHLGLLAAWVGSMGYSLVIVQPRIAGLFAADDERLEEVSVVLGAGNRRPVLAIVVALYATLAGIVLMGDLPTAALVLTGVEAVTLLAATAIFASVSWRLWPRRVFALPAERPAHRTALRRRALAMTVLVGTAFVIAASTAQL